MWLPSGHLNPTRNIQANFLSDFKAFLNSCMNLSAMFWSSNKTIRESFSGLIAGQSGGEKFSKISPINNFDLGWYTEKFKNQLTFSVKEGPEEISWDCLFKRTVALNLQATFWQPFFSSCLHRSEYFTQLAYILGERKLRWPSCKNFSLKNITVY